MTHHFDEICIFLSLTRQLLKEKKEFDFAKQLEEEEEERSKLSVSYEVISY